MSFTDCDVIEIEIYEELLAKKQTELQAKVDSAFAGAFDVIKTKQIKLIEMINADPRISLEDLNTNLQVEPMHQLENHNRENLAFFGLRPSVYTHSPVDYPPRLCLLVKENESSRWGFSLKSKSVVSVTKHGAAEKAGIKENDQILEINDISVAELKDKQIVDILMQTNNDLSLLVK